MALKLAYVAFLPTYSAGIDGALRGKARAFGETAAAVDVIVVNRHRAGRHGGMRFVVRSRHSPGPSGYPATVLRRYRLIERAVDLDAYDVVILRYPAADPSGPLFAPSTQVVAEHHSNTIAEMQSYSTMRLPPTERLMKRVRLDLERRYGAKVLGAAAGLIGVTEEITRLELKRVTVDDGRQRY